MNRPVTIIGPTGPARSPDADRRCPFRLRAPPFGRGRSRGGQSEVVGSAHGVGKPADGEWVQSSAVSPSAIRFSSRLIALVPLNLLA